MVTYYVMDLVIIMLLNLFHIFIYLKRLKKNRKKVKICKKV